MYILILKLVLDAAGDLKYFKWIDFCAFLFLLLMLNNSTITDLAGGKDRRLSVKYQLVECDVNYRIDWFKFDFGHVILHKSVQNLFHLSLSQVWCLS